MTDDRIVDLLERIAVACEAIAARAVDGNDVEFVALRAALEDYFGPAPFTAGGAIAASEESDALADAIASVIDLNAPVPGPAIALGRLLARTRTFVRTGESRGAALYRIRQTESTAGKI